MVATIDSIGSQQYAPFVGSVTFAHTCSGDNRLIVVNSGGFSIGVLGVTYAGDNLTLADSRSTGSQNTYWHYKVTPTSGANNVVVTFTGPFGVAMTQATSWNGVNQTTPVGTATTNSGTGTSATVTAGSVTGDMVQDVMTANSSLFGPSAGGGQTIMTSVDSANSTHMSNSYKTAGDPSTTMTWSWSLSRTWNVIAVAIKPVASAANPQPLGFGAAGIGITTTGPSAAGASN